MIVYLTVDQAIKIHDRLIEQHGGLPGIRDLGLLASAMEMPKGSFDNYEMHPTLYDKASAYLFYLAKNHPFLDGNKRTAAFIALLFLKMNGLNIHVDQMQYELLVIGTAEGLIAKTQISHFFEKSHMTIPRSLRKRSSRIKRRR
jgi:death on curing protein